MAIHEFALLADADGWMRLIVPAVFVIFWVLTQLANVGGGKKNPRPRRQPQQPKGGLAQEIESFLDQVRKGQGADQGQQKPVAAVPERQRRPQRPEQPRREPQRPQRRPLREPLKSVQEEVVEAELVEPRLSDRGDSVKKRQPQAQRKQRRTALSTDSDSVDQADEKMAEHVQEVFGHSLGQLADTSDAIHEKTKSSDEHEMPAIPTTADAVRDMLATPDSVRSAVILAEILRRPVVR